MVHIVMVTTKHPGGFSTTIVDSVWNTAENAEKQINFYRQVDAESECNVDTYHIHSCEVFTEEPDSL